ncbi:MAG TPA: TolC family protein [Candidatus Eisenbacteria bacterium]|nr:TolC family protein [Candidatus Eisenbacteria bacterium]
MRSGTPFRIFILAIAAGATALTVAPFASAADSTAVTPPAAEATAAPAAPAAADGVERWSLARCIETALRQNGDVRAARARTTQARGGALSGWSNVLPSVTGDASFTRLLPDEKSSLTAVEIDSTLYTANVDRRDVTSLSAGVQANLFDLPAWSAKRRLDHRRSSAEESEAETRNDVVFRVRQQYFECVKAERLAEVARESERLARDEETRSEALFQVGSVARGDVLKARARRASTQLSRIQAQNQVEIQRQRLKQLIGLEGPAGVAVEMELEGTVPIPDSAAVVAQALRARPTLASAHAAERAARSGLFGARTARAPRVTGSVNVDRSKYEDKLLVSGFDDIEDSRTSTQWTGTLRLSVPIFDGFAIEGNMRSAKGSLLEAEAARRQLELDVAFEAREAWLLLKEAVERIDVAREGVASAEEDHKFSKGRYELGAGTFLDLLNAQVSLEQARQQLVEALADARVAEAALERAIGERRY